MQDPIISVSGLRGIVGESLTPTIVSDYVASFSMSLPPGAMVISRDGRPSGRMVAEVVRGTLTALGRNVTDAGVAATPTLGTLVRKYQAVGGIQISASHNPAPYNGLKLFGHEGRVLSADAGEHVLRRYRDLGRRAVSMPWVSHDQLGVVCHDHAPHDQHRQWVLETVDVDAIRDANFRVLLDANHGAGSLLGARLLADLGCDVVVLGEPADGSFAHLPEPTAANLSEVARQTAAERCHVGFCQDPDADRLALIDERGRYVGEEYTLALCCEQVLSHAKGPIVTNCSTSRMTEDLAHRFGVPFHRSKVGEANVADLMIAKQAIFGGEGNGGPIDPRVGYVRDSFVGMARVLSLMAQRRQPLSELAAALPKYGIFKTSIPLAADGVAGAVERLKAEFADARCDCLDGLRLDWPDKWLLVRASNTEPIVRLIGEAATVEQAEAVCQQAMAVIGG